MKKATGHIGEAMLSCTQTNEAKQAMKCEVKRTVSLKRFVREALLLVSCVRAAGVRPPYVSLPKVSSNYSIVIRKCSLLVQLCKLCTVRVNFSVW